MDKIIKLKELQSENSEFRKRVKELEAELKEFKSVDDLKSRIVHVFRSTPHLMAIIDLETGKYVDANENFLKVLGYSREEIIKKRSRDIKLFLDMAQSDKFVSKLPKLKRVENFPVNLKTKSGKEKQFLLSADTICFGDDKYLLTVYTGIGIDDGLETNMANAVQKVRGLFESLTNFVMAVNFDRHENIIIESINPDAGEFKHLKKEDLLQKKITSVDFKHKDVIVDLISKIRLTGEPQKEIAAISGKDSEGYFLGVNLLSGVIVIIWEPGSIQLSREKEFLMQGDMFQRFADMMPEVVFEINTKGRITYANSNGLDKFGYEKEDIENGLTIREIFGDHMVESVFGNLKKIKGPGSTISNEYLVYRKDGTTMPVISNTRGIYDQQNKLVGYRGILTDLSELNKIQNEIIREKSYLEALFESAPESIVQTNLDGVIERVNKEFTKEFGFTPEEAIGKNVDELIIPEELKEEARGFTLKAALTETVAVESVRMRKGGERFSVSLLVKPIQINKETTALHAIYRNISDKKKDLDTNNVIYNISNAALTQTEFTDIYAIIRDEIDRIWNTKNFFIVLYHKESHTFTLPFFSDEKDDFSEIPAEKTLTGWLIKNPNPVLLKEADIDILEKKGEIGLVGTPCKVWLGVPLIVENEIVGAMVLQDYDSEDVFSGEDLRLLSLIGNQIALAIQRKKLMNNLILERQKAEEAGRLKQQFMSTMSHEIRTPLNEVIGITNLLLQGKPRGDQIEYIKTLRFSGNHLLTLVNDVLDYTKMESGIIVFEKIQFDLREFIGEFQRSYSFKSDSKTLDFRTNIDEELPSEIIGDSIRLNQVLSNLLSNAFKFTSKGIIELSVKLLGRNDKSAEIEFSVKDTGIGIPADKHDTIFESYTQASDDTTRKYGGTGLGLPICKRLLELQGSAINVESAPGKGSRFSFILRFAVGKVTSKKAIKTQEEETYDGLSGKRILIAEDNKINFFVTSKFLTKWGARITHAENGKIALELLIDNEFDLVLMDLQMPVMDGIEATEKIRGSDDKKIAGIPVVALTAAIMSEHEDKIKGLKINDYILKPFKPKELYDKILRNIR
ncbi:MAG TPA: PAS domain S-box protein [Bacteroidales bacterium]|nr:PAS domain S-box protein [Bacteroidales bacterium]